MIVGHFRFFLGFLSIFLCACQASDSYPILVKGSAEGRELATGQIQGYRVRLARGDLFSIKAEVEDIGLRISLARPDDSVAITEENIGSPPGTFLFEWVSDQDGVHLLRVEGRRPPSTLSGRTFSGSYQLSVENAHQPSGEELQAYKRRTANKLYAEGDALSVRPEASSRKRAIEVYTRSLLFAQQIDDRPLEALIFNSIGLVYFSLGDSEAAMANYRRALDGYQEVGDLIGETDIHFSVGQVLLERGDVERARNLFQQAAESYRTAGKLADLARALNYLGRAQRELGDYKEAQQSFRESLMIAESIGDKTKEANARTALGLVEIRTGDFQSAKNNLESAYEYYQSAGDAASRAALLANLAQLAASMGDLEGALDLLQTSLQVARGLEDRKLEARAVNDIGHLNERLGHFRPALGSYEDALELFRVLGDRGSEATALENLARVQAALGSGEPAKLLLGEALQIRMATGNLPGQAFALQSLGIVYNRTGEPIEAQRFFNQSLAIARKISDRRSEAVSLRGLAQAELAQGNPEKALEYGKQALEVTELVRANVADQDFRSTFLSSTREFYELQTEILMELERRRPGEDFAEKALQASETARARSLLELLSEAHVDVRHGITPGLKELERSNRERLSRLQGQLISLRAQPEPDRSKIAALDEDLRTGEEERLRLQERIRTEHPRYASLQYPSPLSSAEIQRHLDPDTALLEYALSPQTSYLFVLTREGLTTHTLPGETALIPDVQALREILIRPGRRGLGRYKQLGCSLYQTLLGPAEAAIAQKKRLIVVPDGILTYLAFESLLTAADGEHGFGELPYLLDRWAVSYVPSATVLGSLAAKTETSAPAGGIELFAVGDPVYDLPQTTSGAPQTAPELGWEPLRGLFGGDGAPRIVRLEDSAREVRTAAEIFGRSASKLLIGKDASEVNVKRSPELRTASYVHFATHGLISERNPQYSGLVLNLDDDPTEDGLFQVYEIFDLDLSADLVVLSACRSGLGKDVRGEGLVGLTRAFFYAGAPSVVVSLWPVADRSTADLMASFYRHLRNGASKTEALRLAKLELRRAGRFQHPYYWAPFVLTGRP